MYASSGHPRRWAILAVMCLALVVTALDTLIVTMALPSIKTELGASLGQLQWIVDAYSLSFAAPILFAGALADRFGRRLGFLAGMSLFLLASIGAVVADSAAALIVARSAMGVGAALIMPSTLSLLRHVFPAHERAKAMGIWVGVASLGVPIGPLVGGALLENFWWGSVFLINVPIIAAAIIGCIVLIPESRNEKHAGLDIPGLALSIVGSLLLVDGIIEAPERGWLSPRTSGFIALGAAILVGFALWERKAANPMLDETVLANRRFGGPLITVSTVFFGIFGGLFLVTQHLQFTLGYKPLTAGLHLLPMCSAVLVAPVAPVLVQRFGLGKVSMFGPLMVGAGMAVLALGGPPSGLRVMASMALLGMGIGFGAPTSVDSILAATPPEQAGAGSAVADVAVQFAGALGIALMGSVAATANGGFGTGAAVGIGVGVIGALAVRFVVPSTPAPAAATSEPARQTVSV